MPQDTECSLYAYEYHTSTPCTQSQILTTPHCWIALFSEQRSKAQPTPPTPHRDNSHKVYDASNQTWKSNLTIFDYKHREFRDDYTNNVCNS